MNKTTLILLNALADLISMAAQYAGYRLVMYIIGLFMLNPTLLAVITLIANIAYIVFALSPLSTKMFNWMRVEILYWYGCIRYRTKGRDSLLNVTVY